MTADEFRSQLPVALRQRNITHFWATEISRPSYRFPDKRNRVVIGFSLSYDDKELAEELVSWVKRLRVRYGYQPGGRIEVYGFTR